MVVVLLLVFFVLGVVGKLLLEFNVSLDYVVDECYEVVNGDYVMVCEYDVKVDWCYLEVYGCYVEVDGIGDENEIVYVYRYCEEVDKYVVMYENVYYEEVEEENMLLLFRLFFQVNDDDIEGNGMVFDVEFCEIYFNFNNFYFQVIYF